MLYFAACYAYRDIRYLYDLSETIQWRSRSSASEVVKIFTVSKDEPGIGERKVMLTPSPACSSKLERGVKRFNQDNRREISCAT